MKVGINKVLTFSFIGLKPVNTELVIKEKTKITGMNTNGQTTCTRYAQIVYKYTRVCMTLLIMVVSKRTISSRWLREVTVNPIKGSLQNANLENC